MEEEIDQEEICAFCSDKYYDGAVNSNPFYLCEGSKCDQAREEYMELFIDDFEDENGFIVLDIPPLN